MHVVEIVNVKFVWTGKIPAQCNSQLFIIRYLVIYFEIIYFTVTVEILTVLLAGISLNNKIDDIHDRGSNNFGVLRK